MRLIILILCIPCLLFGQGIYAPPAGQAGSTAIHRDSSIIASWATTQEIHRGYLDIASPSLGQTSYGTPHDVLGKSNDAVVSLGDSGYAIIMFDGYLYNGAGSDFAIFENAINDDFLEFAFVEVSSDGQNYVRFPSVSLTQDTIQTGSFGATDATNIHNLAGKYRAQYGTPFDLEDIKDSVLVDINHISHIKIIDVIGAIERPFTSKDHQGNSINDPYPTAFASGGFDLDAVAAINLQQLNTKESIKSLDYVFYPNPVENIIYWNPLITEAYLYNLQGKLLKKLSITEKQSTDIRFLPKGTYFIKVKCIGNFEQYFSLHKK